jgi:hypothetical protein
MSSILQGSPLCLSVRQTEKIDEVPQSVPTQQNWHYIEILYVEISIMRLKAVAARGQKGQNLYDRVQYIEEIHAQTLLRVEAQINFHRTLKATQVLIVTNMCTTQVGIPEKACSCFIFHHGPQRLPLQ